MYLAAMEEERTRIFEQAISAAAASTPGPGSSDGSTTTTTKKKKKKLTPEQVQRLSLFRVKKYYEKIDHAKAKKAGALPENWAFVMPLKVGDEVDADLGGAFFPATITRVLPGTVGLYDLTFFDGDQEKGMERKLIKLLKPPAVDNDNADDQVDTSTMTPKQLKRWKKAQQKKKKK